MRLVERIGIATEMVPRGFAMAIDDRLLGLFKNKENHLTQAKARLGEV
jgi:hypothetical protein